MCPATVINQVVDLATFKKPVTAAAPLPAAPAAPEAHREEGAMGKFLDDLRKRSGKDIS
jgi:hypothetical protein